MFRSVSDGMECTPACPLAGCPALEVGRLSVGAGEVLLVRTGWPMPAEGRARIAAQIGEMLGCEVVVVDPGWEFTVVRGGEVSDDRWRPG